MIRIAVYDSNSVMIAGLVSILAQLPDLHLVGSFVDQASLTTISDRPFDLLLVEQLPEAEWWWLEEWLLTVDFKPTGILLIDSLTTEEIDEYLHLGFKGFLPRLTTTEEAIATINAVVAGLMVIHPDLASFDDSKPAISPEVNTEVYLTGREIEVLQLLGVGLDNKAIASTLKISKHTVKFHLSSIFSKLDVSSRTEAVTLGLRQGLIRL
ncbi:MAG: response regulator transcription factor [Cyanobacteria bacterium P01_G01_bin.67]